jgi:hypothetical protein
MGLAAPPPAAPLPPVAPLPVAAQPHHGAGGPTPWAAGVLPGVGCAAPLRQVSAWGRRQQSSRPSHTPQLAPPSWALAAAKGREVEEESVDKVEEDPNVGPTCQWREGRGKDVR